MPARHQRLRHHEASELASALAALREELELPGAFTPEAAAEAAATATAVHEGGRPPLPDADLTDIDFITIDPAGSTDLDQALHITRDETGFVVQYAIADVPALVTPGGAVDQAARERGQTLYAADGRIPLHPVSLSEDAGSLLAGAERAALVWRFELDSDGVVTDTSLSRARIRNREQLSYVEAQRRVDDGTANETLRLLAMIGPLRIALEAERGGASLDMPEEEIVHTAGTWQLERRVLLPVEQWNAHISLMTGMEAAQLMLNAGAGILRTMPHPDDAALTLFRKEVAAIGLPWQSDKPYGAYLRGLDRDDPRTLAVLTLARKLFRGAGYTVLTGSERAEDVTQSAIAAPYAHATAPLRRLVDRYVLAHCLAIAQHEDIPTWASDGLADLAEIMQKSGQLARKLERASVDLVEIAVLAARIGETFDAVVIESSEQGATVQLTDPAVEARIDQSAEPGERIRVRLQEATLGTRTLRFEPA